MNKIKLIIHERFNGKRSLENVFFSAFQSESYQLLQEKSSTIMNVTEQSQDLFSFGKDLKMEQGFCNGQSIRNMATKCMLSCGYFPEYIVWKKKGMSRQPTY